MNGFSTVKGLMLATVFCCSIVSAEELPPVEAYARHPLIDDAAISADGNRLAVIRNEPGGKSRLLILDIKSAKTLRTVETPPHAHPLSRDRMRGVRWAGDNHVTYGLIATVPFDNLLGLDANLEAWDATDFRRVVSLDLATGQNKLVHQGGMADLFLSLSGIAAPVAGDLNSGRVVLPQRGSLNHSAGLYRVDLKTGMVTLKMRGIPDTEGFAINPEGHGILRLDFDRVAETWQLLRIDGDSPIVLSEGTEAQGVPWQFGLLDDGTPAMLTRAPDADRAALHALDTNGDVTTLRTLVNDDVHDVGDVIFDPWSHAIVGARTFTPEGPREQYLSSNLAAARTAIQSLFKGAYITLWNWSENRSRFVFFAERGSDAGGVYLFDMASRQVSLLGMMRPEIKLPAALGGSQAITFKARDGRTLNAILTLPADSTATKHPTIVLASDDPTIAASPNFSQLPSLFASRGFAVIEVDERGTYGWGRAVEDAGLGKFSTGVVDDFEDAALALVRAGIADGERLCAVGMVSGAYTAAAAATRTGNLFRCLISINGVLDLPRYHSHLGRYWHQYSRWRMEFRRRFGADLDSSARMKVASPAHHAEHLNGPVLLVTTMSAASLPASQAESMARRARSAGKTVNVVKLPLVDGNLLHEDSLVISFQAALEHLQRAFPDR